MLDILKTIAPLFAVVVYLILLAGRASAAPDKVMIGANPGAFADYLQSYPTDDVPMRNMGRDNGVMQHGEMRGSHIRQIHQSWQISISL